VLIVELIILFIVVAQFFAVTPACAQEGFLSLIIDVSIKSETYSKILNGFVVIVEDAIPSDIKPYVNIPVSNVSIPEIEAWKNATIPLILEIDSSMPISNYEIPIKLQVNIGGSMGYITYSMEKNATITTPIKNGTIIKVEFVIRETDYVKKLVWRGPPPSPKVDITPPTKPFNAILEYETKPPQMGTIYILVNATLYYANWTSVYKYFNESLSWYIKYLEEALGYSVRLYTIDGGTPENIRALLQNGLPGIVGAIIVGDLPVAWYEMVCWDSPEVFPTDLFYMDLNGYWGDADGDRLYDTHDGRVGDVKPEIWVGRLDVPDKYMQGLSADKAISVEQEILTNYFKRNYDYRGGWLLYRYPKRALIYIDDDWVDMADGVDKSLAKLYNDRTVVTNIDMTNADDYKNRIDDGWEWVHLQCHGWPGGHVFKNSLGWDGTIYTYDYENIPANALFYQFFVCSGARFTEPDYLAGSAVFRTNTDYTSGGLLAIGSTKTGSMLYFEDFYRRLSEGKSIGDAFKEWFIEYGESSPCWFYGLVLIGDPTLKVLPYNQYFTIELSSQPPYNPMRIMKPPTIDQWSQREIEIKIKSYNNFNSPIMIYLDWHNGTITSPNYPRSPTIPSTTQPSWFHWEPAPWWASPPLGTVCVTSYITPPPNGTVTARIKIGINSLADATAYHLTIYAGSYSIFKSKLDLIQTNMELIRDTDTGRVYYIYRNNKHWITTPWAFEKYKFRWSDIRDVSHSEAESYINSYNLDGAKPLPGALIRDKTTGAVYYIYQWRKYWITSPNAFNKYGFNWKEILDLDYAKSLFSSGYNLDGNVSLPKDGILLRDLITGAVYYMYQGVLYWITSPAAFNSYGFDWKNVKNIPHDYIIEYKKGYNLNGSTPLPGTLIRDISTGAVYYIYYGKKYWITSPNAFNKYGFNWGYVINLPHIDIEPYPLGYNLNGSNPLPKDKILIRDISTGAVYFLHGGKAYWITSPEAFNNYGFQWKQVINVPHEIALSFSRGYNLNGTKPLPRNGLLIRDISNGAVYYLYGSNIYWITSPAAFNSYGFNWSDVKNLTHEDILYYQKGYNLDGANPLPS
jgi:hypothetical protein